MGCIHFYVFHCGQLFKVQLDNCRLLLTVLFNLDGPGIDYDPIALIFMFKLAKYVQDNGNAQDWAGLLNKKKNMFKTVEFRKDASKLML
jgi:hypothetical protein